MAGIEGAPIPDSRPEGSEGVTAEDVAAQQSLIDLVGLKTQELNAAIEDADASVNKAASLATVLDKVTQLVETVAPMFASKPSQAEPSAGHVGLVQQILAGAAEVAATPKANRLNVGLNAVASILRGSL